LNLKVFDVLATNDAFRFCDAMIEIRKEAEDIITGKQPKDNNLLKNAPHPISTIASSEWNRFVKTLYKSMKDGSLVEI
jgi:glycine cleavage system protein P-like pyridoxal-binding family